MQACTNNIISKDPSEMLSLLRLSAIQLIKKIKASPEIFNYRASNGCNRGKIQHYKNDTILVMAGRLLRKGMPERILVLVQYANRFSDKINFLNEVNANKESVYTIKNLNFFEKTLLNNFVDNPCVLNNLEKADIHTEKKRLLKNIKFQFKQINPKNLVNKAIELCENRNLMSDFSNVNEISSVCSSEDYRDPENNSLLCAKEDTILHVLTRLSIHSKNDAIRNNALSIQNVFIGTIIKSVKFKSISKAFINVKNYRGEACKDIQLNESDDFSLKVSNETTEKAYALSPLSEFLLENLSIPPAKNYLETNLSENRICGKRKRQENLNASIEIPDKVD